MDLTMEMATQFAEMNPIMLENFNMADVSVETLLACKHPGAMGAVAQSIPSGFESSGLSSMPVAHNRPVNGNTSHDSKRRKVMEQSQSSSSGSALKGNGSAKKKNVSFSALLLIFSLLFLNELGF